MLRAWRKPIVQPLFFTQMIERILSPARQHSLRQRGFTLMELLVVFAIMALLAVVVPVAYVRMQESSQYRDTVRHMRAELRAAREFAVQTQEPARFSVDLQNKDFSGAGGKGYQASEEVELRATVADVALEGNIASIVFLPQGGSSGGSIDILRANGDGTRLRVDWLTGQITQEAVLR